MTDHHHVDESIGTLARTLLLLETEEEALAFLTDLCTIREMNDMSQRLEVATMLDAGKNYQDISAATGASTATISRVNRALQYGKGGYRALLNKTKEN